MKARGINPKAMHYRMLLQGLVATCQIEAGFELLERAKASGHLTWFADNCHPMFPMFRAMLEACRAVGDSDSASAAHAMVKRLGLRACAPVAMKHAVISVRVPLLTRG